VRRRVFAPRFLVEVALIAAVAAAGVLSDLRRMWVFGVIWAAWLLVVAFEWGTSRHASAPPEPEEVAPPDPEPAPLAADGSQTWNLWDLERIARAHAIGDAARDEERSFLLMYLRDFADPDGLLSPEFDALVRESFGEAALR
jgi:hypothetical protein